MADAWKHRIIDTAEVDASTLMANPKNWRVHPEAQRQALAGVLGAVGWVQRIIVNRRTGCIVDGHLRTEMAAEKHEIVPVGYVDLTEAEEALILASLDPIGAQAEADQEKLNALLAEIRASPLAAELSAPLTEMLDSLRLDPEPEPEPTEGEDAVPEVPIAPVTVAGDVWVLGDHRVVCGDATKKADVDAALAGGEAAMVFTDPPYNVNYGATMKDNLRDTHRPIANDNLGVDFAAFLRAACDRMLAACRGAIYICMSSSEIDTLQRVFREAGGHWSTFVVWAKNTFTMGRSDYQRQYEPILYGWREGVERFWCGARDQGDVWFIKKPHVNDLHPTMKPVELVERAVRNSSRPGDVVLDPFGGSGTTLIACEKARRQARVIELDPKYCDVIVERWQTFTGREAVLGNGDHAGTTFAHAKRGRRQAEEDSIQEEALNAA